jgi:hypothetical protein
MTLLIGYAVELYPWSSAYHISCQISISFFVIGSTAVVILLLLLNTDNMLHFCYVIILLLCYS